MVLGDFNSILNSEERVGEAVVRPHHFANFLDYVTTIGLTNMRYRGNFLTWTNKQDNRCWCKLDKVLINAECNGEFVDFEGRVSKPKGNISPSMVIYSLKQKHRKRKSYKFFNYWAQEEGFMDTVWATLATTVRGNSMFILVQKLKIMKYALI